MTEDNEVTITSGPGIMSAYFRIGAAILVGALLVLGIYFFVVRDDPKGPAVDAAGGMCACPNCGLTIPRPAGLDCEEIHCPNCGHSMTQAAVLAAAAQGQGMTVGPLTQNRRETLAEQGIVTPGPLTQNQRETLAEQGITMPVNPQRVVFHGGAGLPAATTQLPMGRTGTCVCPSCGRRIARQPGVSCSQMRCPNCGTTMTNAVFIGQAPSPKTPSEPIELRLAAMRGAATCPQAQAGGHGGGAAPCPPRGTATGAPGGNTYSHSVRGIIQRNCLRCHGGPIRNLTSYDRVKSYVDNGLLMMMIQPGGPMSRFLSADEAHRIISWIEAGAPP